MVRYRVDFTSFAEVEACDEDEAFEKAYEKYNKDPNSFMELEVL